MKIRLNEMKFYFLTCNNEKRRKHILEEFKDYDLTEVNPVLTKTGISKQQSGSTGFSRMIDIATTNQDRSKPFQPFIIIEDDVKKYREFPEELEIPDNADILYTGLSIWAMTNNSTGSSGALCCSDCGSYTDVVRVKNMLSTHGLMICSVMGLLTLQKCIYEDFYKNRGYDMSLAHIQPYINAYALRKPLVYQCKPMGGQESSTMFEITNEGKYKHFMRELPNEWVNTKNMSVITKYVKL